MSHSPRWLQIVRFFLALNLLLAPLTTLSQARTAQALDSTGVTEVITGLQSLGTVVNSLSGIAGLGEPIPFTDVDPSEALNLDTLFSDALGALGAPANLEALATTLDAKDNADLNGTGIAVAFDDVVGDDTANTLAFNFVATRTMTVPLAFAGGEVDLDGSDISVTFTLEAPLAFGYDGSASNPNEKVFLTNTPTIAVAASADVPAITAFESLLGFTSVSVGGNLALNVAINSTFADPDLNGRLTVDEWASTALGDLVSVAFADGPGNDIDGHLDLDATIVPGAPDATVVWVDVDLTNGPGTPVVTLNALDDFTNINPSDIFGGLASATTALLSAQASGDLPLPFLQDSVSDIFQFADPLVDFVHELGDAAIVCGTEDTVPPSGSVFGLSAGDTVYCQAYTINPVDLVEWKIGGVISDTNTATVGPNPSATAPLVLGAGGMDSLTLDFRFQGEGNKRTASPLFLTADQLAAKLASIAGIDTVTAAYDGATRTLTYQLQESLPDANKVVETNFGDQLKADTGLFGLNPAGSDQITVEASGISMDVTFGVILVEDPEAIKTEGTDADRFFLQVDPAGNEFQADIDIAAGSNFGLEGRLAFLRVTAAGVDTASNGAIFALGDSDDAPGAPALALNINAPGINGVSLPQPIPDAILLSELISGGIGSKIDAQCELGLSSGLEVKATVGSNTELASGKVAVTWPDVFEDGTCTPYLAGVDVVPDGDFNENLFSFDINPANPAEMLSIILDSIAGFAQAVDGLGAVGDLDVDIPIVGVSPRELLDKLEEINTAINDARSEPAETLQALETQLEQELGIDPNALSFELGDITPGGEKDLILRLGYSKADNITKPLNFQLDDAGLGLVSASNAGNISFGYTAGAQFDVAIPLKPNSALADTRVLETTQASVGGTLDVPGLDFTAAVGPLEVGVTGVAKLDADLVVENADTNPLTLGNWASGVTAELTGDTQDCGTDSDGNALTGQACARLDLDLGGPIGTLGFRAEDITNPDPLNTYPDWYVSIPPTMTNEIASNLLNFALLFDILPELSTKLQGLLEQGAEDVSVPGLGETLDAGAEVVELLNNEVINPLSDIGSAVTGATAKDIEDQIEAEVLSLTVLLDRTSDDTVDAADVDVVARCGASDCADGDPALSVDDVQVTFLIGQEISENPAFDIGIDGLPIEASGAMEATGSWSLLLDVGLSKAEGPYIVANGTMDPELQLHAGVGIGENTAPGSCAADPSDPTFFPAGEFSGFSDTECLEGKLAFLTVGLYDGASPGGDNGDDPTEITLDTTLDLTSSASTGRLTIGNIINSVGLEPRFVADANIDLAIRTSIDVTDGLPGVVGAFHLAWNFDTDNANLGAPDVEFDKLYLDAGTFTSDLLGPVVTEVRKVTSPLEPIVDFIQAEVPVLTQLAELVGEDPVTVLTLIQTSAGFSDEDINLIESVLQLINLANSLPTDAGEGNLFIPLGEVGAGSFTLYGDKLLGGSTTPDQALTLINQKDAGTNLADELAGNSSMSLAAAANTRPGTFGVEGLTFPFLDDATQIFGLLLGQDVTIVRMDFGTFKASVSEGYEFGPIFIGPFPVTAEIGLSFTAEARFAMGYDTRGLRLVIDGGNPIKLFNGIFIDDLNAEGVDVDEWKLTFRVYAEAALDVVIVEAGVYGGVDAILSGNLNDSPNPDGKLYIDEIVDKLSNPICLFTISGKLDLFLGFYLEVDLLFWSDRWELEIIRATLLDFTLGCEGENPNLAEVDGNGNLILNMGSPARRAARGIQTDVIDEEFTVRQIGADKVSVEAFGIKEEEDGVTGKVIANADDGDDVIAFVKGGNDENPIAFTIGSDLEGGSGNDSFTGGDGVDDFSGGSGVDKLIGGKGNDILKGNGGDDRIDGGIGNDDLQGGAGNDIVTGGPGADTIDGGEGNDSLLGGPYTDANPDGADTITGGPGNDNLDGSPGDDLLYGDEAGLDCLADGAAPGGIDAILGGPGNDTLVGGNNNDSLTGGEGNDKLCGNGGDDTLDGDDDDAGTTDSGDRDTSGSGGFAGGLFGGSGDDTMYGRGGDDEMFGGADDDEMYGSAGDDTMQGDAGKDEMYGDDGQDDMHGNAGDDTMYGGANADTMYGDDNDDEMYGDDGDDTMFGNDGMDVMRGGADDDTMQGNAGDDEMYGDSGNDHMEGNEDDDTMRGNTGDDYMEGNGGIDTMYGDAGQDDMIGGSDAAAQADRGDIMFGGAGQDVMAGDNASISRPGGEEVDGTTRRNVVLYDLASGNADTTNAGIDDMQGDASHDDLYGGGENDMIDGNAGDDYIEGNGGGDTINGNAGQDDIVGGTSQEEGGTPDDGDTIHGDAGYDVVLGDNGSITRTPKEDESGWETNTFNGSVLRTIVLFDVAEVGGPAVSPLDSGNDTIHGDAEDDLLYGQGDDDEMHGGDGQDVMQGNAGDDEMYGDADDDDMIGGTGRINQDPVTGVDGRLDGDDEMHGGDGQDAMAGDNAVIERPLAGGQWQTHPITGAVIRTIHLKDVENVDDIVAVDPGTRGDDTIYGDADEDQIFGQGAEDELHGGDGFDYIEGNHGADLITGDGGEDDIIGGGSADDGLINPNSQGDGLLDGDDTIHGDHNDGDQANGDDGDVIAGDNARLTRTEDGTDWLRDPNTNLAVRTIQLFDVENVDDIPAVDPGTSGDDTLHGEGSSDQIFGQGGDDEIRGGDAFDYLEGNHGGDTMFGDAGEDDMVGGGSADDGLIDADRQGDGLLDGADEMHGDHDDGDETNGDDGDVMAGDNARIDRGDPWQFEPNTGDVIRQVTLFDVEYIGGPTIDPDTSGSDTMFGEGGRDYMFGQGNDQVDDDGDGHFNEDPADGVDNDLDGRESGASVGFDCLDGIDNDGNGDADSADPDCQASIDEDGGGDEMHGGGDDDVMEGNHGGDWMFGDGGQDDMLGGSSADMSGVIGSGFQADHGENVSTGLLDGDDTMNGDSGAATGAGHDDDVMLADNGRIARLADEGTDLWLRQTDANFDQVVRDTWMAEMQPAPAGTFGNDYVRGNGGHDDIYGQQGDDLLRGDHGQDALVGDLGLISNDLLGEGTIPDIAPQQHIAPHEPFVEDDIYVTGTLFRLVELYLFGPEDGAAGNDILLGDDGDDSIHAGPGDDLMNGDGDGTALLPDPDVATVDEDHLFGGEGNDVGWGGRGHDHTWGGYGDDYLDVRPRPAGTSDGPGPIVSYPADPPEWFVFGRFDHFQDTDYIYGGWDQDAMQANVADEGPVVGDRLLDWVGAYNVYYLCPGLYGEYVATRDLSPGIIAFLQALAAGDGAIDTATSGTSGFNELAMVFPKDVRFNSNPVHPDNPGHFVCTDEEATAGDVPASSIVVDVAAEGQVFLPLTRASTSVSRP